MLCAALLVVTGVSVAQSIDHPPESLSRLSRAVVRGEADQQTVERLASRAEEDLQAVKNQALRSVWEAERLFVLGVFQLSTGREQAAAGLFETSVRSAERAIDQHESSYAHQVLSNSLQQLLSLRGPFYQIANAGRALRSARRAVELDSESASARVSLISYLTLAPAIAGGDPEEAARQIERAQELADGDVSVEFLLWLWRARLHAAAGDRPATRAALDAARDIFPESPLLEDTEADTMQNQGSR